MITTMMNEWNDTKRRIADMEAHGRAVRNQYIQDCRDWVDEYNARKDVEEAAYNDRLNLIRNNLGQHESKYQQRMTEIDAIHRREEEATRGYKADIYAVDMQITNTLAKCARLGITVY